METEADKGCPEGWHRHIFGGGLVQDTAHVADTAYIGPDAKVFGHARVTGGASVYGSAMVYGYAYVCDTAMLYGGARVYGDSLVFDRAMLSGTVRVCGDASIGGSTVLEAGYYDGTIDPRAMGSFSIFHAHQTDKWWALSGHLGMEAKFDTREEAEEWAVRSTINHYNDMNINKEGNQDAV